MVGQIAVLEAYAAVRVGSRGTAVSAVTIGYGNGINRLHRTRLLTRIEGRAPALRSLMTRLHQQHFDTLAARWDTIRGDHTESRRMLNEALDELGVTTPRRVLDIGTGTGQAVLSLAERFPSAELHAVDASPRMISTARAKPGSDRIQFGIADGGDLPFASGMFDLCVSLLVQPFEQECHRVLADGGWALYCYPMGDHTPIWFPSALLRPRLSRAGFSDIRSGTIGRGEWTAARR